MSDRHICAYHEVIWCTSAMLEQRAWSKALEWCADLHEQFSFLGRLSPTYTLQMASAPDCNFFAPSMGLGTELIN